METDKFYLIQNNVVKNVIICREEDAQKLGLKRAPIFTDFGVVSIDWTYLPNEDSFLPPPRNILKEWEALRAHRNMLLQTSDSFVFPDMWATYNQDEQYALSTYRKALRDIPQNTLDPKEVIWPEIPQIMINILEENKVTTSEPEV